MTIEQRMAESAYRALQLSEKKLVNKGHGNHLVVVEMTIGTLNLVEKCLALMGGLGGEKAE